jgi:hypothetical protein
MFQWRAGQIKFRFSRPASAVAKAGVFVRFSGNLTPRTPIARANGAGRDWRRQQEFVSMATTRILDPLATPRQRGDNDAPHMSPVTPSEDMRTVIINRISWSAVLAGVAFALVIQLILNLIGIGIGMATLDPGTADNPSAESFSLMAGLWWLLSGILASFLGGYAAGRLAGKPHEGTAGWHGLIAWAATTLVIVYMLTTAASSLVGGAFSTMTGMANVAGNVAQTSTSTTGNAFSTIEQALRGDNNANADAAVAAMRALVTGDPAQAEQAREQAAQAVAQSQNIPIEQARTQVRQYEQEYRQTATQTAETAANAVSWGSLLGALALILGAAAAWYGGRSGAVDPTLTRIGMMRRRGINDGLPQAGE